MLLLPVAVYNSISMTPFGHLSASYISGKPFRFISLPAILIGGASPDLDFLFIFFDWFNRIHRIVTHNLLFVVLVAVAGMFLAASGRRKTVLFSILLGGMLHLFIDSFMDNNPTNGIGLALFWPFSSEIYSPFNLLQVSENTAGWRDPAGMFRSLVPVMLYELPLYLTALFMFSRQVKKQVLPAPQDLE